MVPEQAGRLAGRIVHSIPGRVRIRYEPDEEFRVRYLAAQMTANALVDSVAWRPQSRSLVVSFDRHCSFSEVVVTLGTPGETAWWPAVGAGRRFNWGRVAVNCLLSALPFGPLGNIAVSLLTSVAEEAFGRNEVWRSGRVSDLHSRTGPELLDAASPA